jgi:ribosomal protein L22
MSPEKKPEKDGEVQPEADATERKPAASGRSAARASAEESAAKKPAAKKPAGEKAAEAKARPAKKPAQKGASGAEKPAAAQKPAGEEKAAAARAKPAKPPRRRVVLARARYVRTSARKARMVSSHLPGKSVSQARAILAFTPREVARDWSKLLESAVANAEHNHELLEDDLVVREAYADEGPTIKRFRPRAMGRATPIHKRTSHLTITLTPGS